MIIFRSGGIYPAFAQEFHRQNIEKVVTNALQNAKLTVADIDAIAVTTRPGKSLYLNLFTKNKTSKFCFTQGIHVSLLIGIRYAKHLARKYSKPIIPIHHMEAHALMARLQHCSELKFPFLCLLASGGHCQLTVVKSVNEFYLLGETLDTAPGSCLDRVARALRLQTLPEYQNFSGGKAIEMAAYQSTNPNRFNLSLPLQRERNCQFSFDGVRGNSIQIIDEIQTRMKLKSDDMIPYYEDFCASLLKVVTKHMLHRTQRAIQYCDRLGIFGYGANALPRSFVFSGGVACNDFIYKALEQMTSQFGFRSFRPAKRLCSDNGVMIAWNGVEKWYHDEMTYRNLDIDSILPERKCELGTSWVEEVAKKKLPCDWVKVPIMNADTLKIEQIDVK